MSGYRVLSGVSEPGEHQATDFAPFVLTYLVVKVAEPPKLVETTCQLLTVSAMTIVIPKLLDLVFPSPA